MSGSTISLHLPWASARVPGTHGHVSARRWTWSSLLVLFLLVAGAQFAFGMWMDARGFVFNDAYTRPASALLALYSSDARLAGIGFVWMPLPGLIELLWIAFYPLWPAVVSSGFASTLTTALAGGATAALLLQTARKLGISPKLGWGYALLVAANPMLFLYGSNGMGEGVAAPFLTGAVCSLVLFWHSGQRRYVCLAGLALALGVASRYEAAPYGLALFAALVLWALRGSRDWQQGTTLTPRRRWRFAEGLGILLIAPSCYVATLWIGANALIMKNPLFFANNQYVSYASDWGVGGAVSQAKGDVLGTLAFAAKRAGPFLIPGIFLIAVRAMDGRFWRIHTLCLMLLLVSVSLGMIAPLVYLGESYGWLRFFMYPLFVAAGWGLYEIARSHHRRAAAGLVLAGWIIAAPFILSAMGNPALGQEEHVEVQSLLTGEVASQTGYAGWQAELAPVARYLESDIFSQGQRVAVDPWEGSLIAAQIPPKHLRQFLVLIRDRNGRFGRMIEEPRSHHIAYLLVPNPMKVPQDTIVQARPGLWAGKEAGFRLVKSFPDTLQDWRLYKVESLLRTTSVEHRVPHLVDER